MFVDTEISNESVMNGTALSALRTSLLTKLLLIILKSSAAWVGGNISESTSDFMSNISTWS